MTTQDKIDVLKKLIFLLEFWFSKTNKKLNDNQIYNNAKQWLAELELQKLSELLKTDI